MIGTASATRARAHACTRRAIVAEAARNLQRARAAELTQADAANDSRYLLRQGLFAEQLRALEDGSRVKGLLCARRAGKTHVLAAMLLDCAVSKDGSLALYLTITRRNAKLIIWRILKRMARDASIAMVPNESELTLTLSNGSVIMLGGADDIAEIEKWRGHAYDLVIVDECGSFPPALLEQLRDDVIEPATADHNGQQVYSGTPGDVLDGPWYEMTGPANDGLYSVHSWTARENTAIPGLWERCLQIKAERNWGDDHPTWLREYERQWVQDSSTLVYPYDDERNGVDGLPTHTTTGVPLNASGWRYALAIDVGYVHATAFALVACHELDPRDFIVETEQHKEMLPEDVIAHVRKHYQPRFPWLPIVVDSGGMGKIHAVTMRRRGHLPVEAAEKRDKPDAVRDLRGRLLSGHTKVLRGPQNDCIRGVWARLGWDDKRESHSKEQEDDIADAALYGTRKLHNFREHAPPKPTEPTPEEVAAKMKAEQIRRYQPRQHPWASGGSW